MLQALEQAWWAPLAGLLVIAQLALAVAFLLADGTSNILDLETTAAGTTLSLGGAAALAVGLWRRPRERALGDGLIIVGAVLAAIWLWAVVLTPIAIAVIVGVVLSRVRTRALIDEAP